MKNRWLALIFFMAAWPAAAQLVTVTASNILDRGAPLTTGTWCATPMGAAGRGFHVGSTGNVTGSAVCRDVANGVILNTLGGVAAGPLQLADTSLTAPLHVNYGITIRDANGAYVLGGPLSGYTQVQPAANNSWCTSGVCNWDLYIPTISDLPLGQSFASLQVGDLTVTGRAIVAVSFNSLPSPANGVAPLYCTDCDAPSTAGTACTSSGAKAGAEAHRIRGAWLCF